jgi:single-strand DNA-binding protein
MTEEKTRTPGGSEKQENGENTVVLRGRVSSGPEGRALPSGAEIVSVRLSVPRSLTPMTRGSKQSVDWVDCVAWGGAVRRSVASWSVGDTVEVRGALRRRYYRGAQGTATRLELEVLRGRRVRGGRS